MKVGKIMDKKIRVVARYLQATRQEDEFEAHNNLNIAAKVAIEAIDYLKQHYPAIKADAKLINKIKNNVSNGVYNALAEF